MVKLASVREIRQYGPRLARNRYEFLNSALHVFATFLLLCGFVCLLLRLPRTGLVFLLMGLALLIVVNVHDLFAHLAGIDYRLWFLGFDPQLALVEVFVPVVQAVGALLSFLGIMFLFIEAKKDYVDTKLEKHALNLLVAGSALWLLGSVHNSFQIYEIVGGYIQVLQASVYIPFLIGSLLFFLGAVINIHEQHQATLMHHGMALLGKSWAWFGIFGSLMFLIGGLVNLVKVLKMQEIDGIQLEKLRGGAQDRLVQERQGRAPLIL